MQTPEHIAADIAARLKELPDSSERHLVAIAGPPGSGKSTVAAELCSLLNKNEVKAGLVAMDGFHLDNAILRERGLLARKGAPETFDLAGFATTLKRLKTEGEVIVPKFDRDLDASIGSAVIIEKNMTIAVVEGNYLLVDTPGWRSLHPFWSYSVFFDANPEQLRNRLLDRWLGFGLSLEEARRKLEGNDLPNARFVLENSITADQRF